MDAKLLFYTFVLYCFTIKNVAASSLSSTEATEDKKCLTKLDFCTLQLINIVKQRGKKGDKGERGFQGILGLKGEKGNDGTPGPEGPQGPKGDRGNYGYPGLMGQKGEIGVNGDPGKMGEKGDKGKFGLQGPKGDTGATGPKGVEGLPPISSQSPPGPVGPPGMPGSPVSCDCSKIFTKDKIGKPDDFGTKENPADSTCKFATAGLQSRTYYIGPNDSPFKVNCNIDTLETCIIVKKRTRESETIEKEKFWLSEVGVDIKEIYGLTVKQVMWLQKHSTYVRQTLKYNCLNSVPYHKTDLSKSIKLLTWNDNVIGPFPTPEYRFFYSVPPETDECTNGSTVWQSTLIELRSTNVYILPIIDVLIGYPHDTNQKMTIENMELCFG